MREKMEVEGLKRKEKNRKNEREDEGKCQKWTWKEKVSGGSIRGEKRIQRGRRLKIMQQMREREREGWM